MSYTVSNITSNRVSAGNHTIDAGASIVVDFIDAPIVAGVNGNYLSITGISATTIAGTIPTLVDNTAGAVTTTLAAGIADAVAKEAIASLAAVVNQLVAQSNNSKALVANLDVHVVN